MTQSIKARSSLHEGGFLTACSLRAQSALLLAMVVKKLITSALVSCPYSGGIQIVLALCGSGRGHLSEQEGVKEETGRRR